jgi:hypothetical protein
MGTTTTGQEASQPRGPTGARGNGSGGGGGGSSLVGVGGLQASLVGGLDQTQGNAAASAGAGAGGVEAVGFLSPSPVADGKNGRVVLAY